MTQAVPNPSNLPAPSTVSMVDTKSGLPTTGWFDYFRQADDRLRKLIAYLGTGSTVVGSLPTAPSVGARAFVTDATATTFHSIVAGGSTNKVPVVFDGTNWLIG